MTVLADDGPAAELMENAVAQISRYLNRVGAPLSSRKHGLVMVAFCRALRRYRAKSARLELVGNSADLSYFSVPDRWLSSANARLDLEKLVRHLSRKNNEVLVLREAGYEWKEIARRFETTESAVRNSFWREIGKIRSGLNGHEASRQGASRFSTSRFPEARIGKSDVVRKAPAALRMFGFHPSKIQTPDGNQGRRKRSLPLMTGQRRYVIG